MRHITDLPSGHRRNDRAIACALVFVFVCGLAALAALVPVGQGFVPKGGGWFRPAVVGVAARRSRPAAIVADVIRAKC